MASFDDGTIARLLVTAVASIVGENVPIYLPGDKAPVDGGSVAVPAWVSFETIDLKQASGGPQNAAEGTVMVAGLVVVGDGYVDTKGKYAMGSLIAKLRAAISYAGLADSPVTHRINLDALEVKDISRDDSKSIRIAMWMVEGRVVRESGTGCVVDYS